MTSNKSERLMHLVGLIYLNLHMKFIFALTIKQHFIATLLTDHTEKRESN
jgi:hypothetical protein